MKKFLVFLLCLLVPSIVLAGEVSLSWDAPTKNSDGTPITYFDKGAGKADYNVYWGTTVGGPYPTKQAVVGNATGSTTYVVTGLTVGTKFCFTATAVNTFLKESARSNEACAVVEVIPGPPLLLRFN